MIRDRRVLFFLNNGEKTPFREFTSIVYFEQNLELTKLKKETATSWLKGIHSQVL